jgi:hypothetical protein
LTSPMTLGQVAARDLVRADHLLELAEQRVEPGSRLADLVGAHLVDELHVGHVNARQVVLGQALEAMGELGHGFFDGLRLARDGPGPAGDPTRDEQACDDAGHAREAHQDEGRKEAELVGRSDLIVEPYCPILDGGHQRRHVGHDLGTLGGCGQDLRRCVGGVSGPGCRPYRIDELLVIGHLSLQVGQGRRLVGGQRKGREVGQAGGDRGVVGGDLGVDRCLAIGLARDHHAVRDRPCLVDQRGVECGQLLDGPESVAVGGLGLVVDRPQARDREEADRGYEDEQDGRTAQNLGADVEAHGRTPDGMFGTEPPVDRSAVGWHSQGIGYGKP